mgnify:FL=1|jgi:hypothetical protein
MDEQNIENEQIQDNQTQDTVQQNNSSDTIATELVDYQTHVIKSLDNLNTMMICQFIIFGVIVGILLSKTLWRRLTV